MCMFSRSISFSLFLSLYVRLCRCIVFVVKGFSSTGEMIVSSPKYNVQETSLSLYETRMTLTIRKFQKDDIGSYRCIAKNSLGEVDSSIRLYGKYHVIALVTLFCCFSYAHGVSFCVYDILILKKVVLIVLSDYFISEIWTIFT